MNRPERMSNSCNAKIFYDSIEYSIFTVGGGKG